MDQTDKAILDLLQRDCSLSYASIAESMSLSVNACHRRVKSLEERGVIERRVAIVNREMVGLSKTVAFTIKLEKNSEQYIIPVVELVLKSRFTRDCYRLIGDQDIFVKMSYRTDEEFNEFYRTLFENKNVTGVSAYPAIEEFRDSGPIALD